jgi:hypothetical protein
MIFPFSNSRAIFTDIRCPPNILGNLSECVMGDNIICLYVWRSAIYLPSAGYNTFGGGVYAGMQHSEIMSGAHPCIPQHW